MKPSISQQLSAFHEAKSMTLPLIALRDVITYPKTHTAVFMARETSLEVVNRTYESSQPLVAFVPQRNSDIEAPEPKDLYDLGVIGVVSQVIELPDGTRKVLVEGLERARIRDVKFETTSFTCTAEVFEPEKDDFLGPVFDELVAKVEAAYSHAASQNGARNAAPLHEPSVPVSVSDREAILYAMLSQTTIPLQRQMELLSRESLTERYEFFYEALRVNDELRDLESRIQMRVKQQIEGNQRDYFINEQIKALRRELNRDEEEQRESDEYLKKLDEEGKDFPEVVRERIQNEAKKLDQMPPSSSESAVVRSYLDTLFEVPWTKRTEISTDLKKAREVLDADHWGLEKVKERILEYLAVQRRVNMTKAPILCFVGAPGVGKTSLGRSIARATGREYVRMALGGVRDEAEIRGHRRTYVGAMPGRVIKSLIKAKVRNPLFLFDEIDKMQTDFRGDPASALLEVLDPEQNNTFEDHYVELPYDLSQVMFVATSNSYNIPAPLLDRMEVISLSGYTEDEKVHIAERHLIPKQMEANGVTDKEVRITEDAVRDIIRYYTREAGVRGLERSIGKILRKIVLKAETRGEGEDAPKRQTVNAKNLHDFLGVRRFSITYAQKSPRVGIVNGLAWTEVGGDILTIEALQFPGKGAVQRTGSLGDVMKESVEAARSVVRSRAAKLGIRHEIFSTTDWHIHFPEGATPKDGPSAGGAITTAMVSVLTGIPVRSDVAMTGEITLRGEVLEIGGLKEKLLAALRGGVKKVLIPADNLKDLEEIPENVRHALDIVAVHTIDEVLAHALVELPKPLTEEEAAMKLSDANPKTSASSVTVS